MTLLCKGLQRWCCLSRGSRDQLSTDAGEPPLCFQDGSEHLVCAVFLEWMFFERHPLIGKLRMTPSPTLGQRKVAYFKLCGSYPEGYCALQESCNLKTQFRVTAPSW